MNASNNKELEIFYKLRIYFTNRSFFFISIKVFCSLTTIKLELKLKKKPNSQNIRRRKKSVAGVVKRENRKKKIIKAFNFFYILKLKYLENLLEQLVYIFF